MKVADESEWQALLAEFAIDPNQDMAIPLRDFVIVWAEAAERLHEESVREAQVIAADPPTVMNPMQCLRRTLRLTEAHVQPMTIGMIGAALVILTMHWEFGGYLYDDMTQIEQHLVDDAARLKIAALQHQAQAHG